MMAFCTLIKAKLVLLYIGALTLEAADSQLQCSQKCVLPKNAHLCSAQIGGDPVESTCGEGDADLERLLLRGEEDALRGSRPERSFFWTRDSFLRRSLSCAEARRFTGTSTLAVSASSSAKPNASTSPAHTAHYT